MTQLIHGHVRGLRRVYAREPIIWATESDLGLAASTIASAILPRMRGVYSINDGKRLDGCRTGTAEQKMLFLDRITLLFNEDIIRLVEEPIITNTLAEGPGSPAQATEAELVQQMRRFKRVTYMPTHATQQVRQTVSGKTDEAGRVVRGQRDDMVIALLLCAFWQNEYAKGRTSQPLTLGRTA